MLGAFLLGSAAKCQDYYEKRGEFSRLVSQTAGRFAQKSLKRPLFFTSSLSD